MMTRKELASVSSFAELRQARADIRSEIDELGEQIVTSAKGLAVKGVKVTAAGVASVLVTRAVKAYVRWRREDPHAKSAEEFVAMATRQIEDVDAQEVVDDLRNKAAMAVQWYQIIARAIEVGRMLYQELVDSRGASDGASEEE